MDTLSLIFHLLNFLAPAVFMAAWLWVFSPILWRHKPAMFKPWLQFVLNSVAGAGVLVAGLVWVSAQTPLTIALNRLARF